MKRLTILLLLICFPALAQRFVEETPTIATLKTRLPGSINRSIFVRGYTNENDGGGGTFIITNSILNVDNGLKIQSTAGATFSYLRQFTGPVSPLWFGCAGNGTTDDTVRLQETITQATAKGYEVLLPEMTFRTTAPLNIPSNARIRGSGPKSIIYAVVGGIGLNFGGVTNVTLSNFRLDGIHVVGVYMAGGANHTLDHFEQSGATVQGAAITAGIIIDGSLNAKLLYPYLHDNGVSGTNFANDFNINVNFSSVPSSGLLIQSPRIINLNSKYGIGIFCQSDAKVIHGYIDMNGKGTPVGQNGYGLFSYGNVGNPCQSISFIDCTITNSYGSGIYVNNTIDSELIGNHLYQTSQQQLDTTVIASGIGVNASAGVRVIGNWVTNSGLSAGITFSSTTNCVAEGNNISLSGTNRPGIYLRGFNYGISIKGNTVWDTTYGIGNPLANGYWMENADIEGNTIRNAQYGIIVSPGSSNNVIRANRIPNATVAGILDQGLNDFLQGNIVTGTGGVGIYLLGTNTMLGPNIAIGQTIPLLMLGQGNRADVFGRYSAGSTNTMFMFSDAAGTNFLYSINGVQYTLPTVTGPAGGLWATDGGGNIQWQLPANIFNFGSQFSVNQNTNITLADGLVTTNQQLNGNVTTLPVNLGSVNGAINVDAGSASEFNLLLSGNSTITFTNFSDYHNVNVTMTNAGNFSLTFGNTMYWIPTGTSTQVTNDWGTGIVNKFSFWRTGGRILASDKEGLAVLSSGAVGANPTALVGLTAVNGASAFFTRSDASPALDQSIAPTWTGNHAWTQNANTAITPVTLRNTSIAPNSNTSISIPFYLRDDSSVEYTAGSLTVGKLIDWTGASTADGFISLRALSGAGGLTTAQFTIKGSGASGFFYPLAIGATDPFAAGNWFAVSTSEQASTNAQKNSPAFVLQGAGYNTGSPGSINTSVGQYVIPVQEVGGLASARWVLESSTTNNISGAPIFEVTSKSTVIAGERLALATNATDGFIYFRAGSGPPLGTPTTVTGHVPFYYDTANNVGYYFNGSWINFAQTSSGANWTANGSTNSDLVGNATANQYISTNGFKILTALYNNNTASLVNAGGTATVLNNSSSRLSNLLLSGGNGAETYINFKAGNVISGGFNTNGAFQTLFGRIINRFAVATNYTVSVTNHYLAVTATCTNTLPAASSFTSGRSFILKNVAGTTTIRPTGADTIDGVAGDYTLTNKLSQVYISDGVSNWELN